MWYLCNYISVNKHCFLLFNVLYISNASSSLVINMDFLNQDCDEGLTEPLINFNTNDGSNQGIVITGDATDERCHDVSLSIQYYMHRLI